MCEVCDVWVEVYVVEFFVYLLFEGEFFWFGDIMGVNIVLIGFVIDECVG